MSDSHEVETAPHREKGFLGLLERGDEFAHLLVSGMLLLAAIAVVGVSTYQFVIDAFHPENLPNGFPGRALTYLSDLLFGVILLELLSTLLTYIKSKNLEATIKDFLIVGIISSVRKILLVGAQSSINGAHPISAPKHEEVAGLAMKVAEASASDDFIKEAIGTTITIVGILLLIVGLIILERRRLGRKKELSEPEMD